jgi:hypothetical protein
MEYVMHAKVKEGDIFTVPFVGFESLADVLAEIDALSVVGVPAFQPMERYETFLLIAADGVEFCAFCNAD